MLRRRAPARCVPVLLALLAAASTACDRSAPPGDAAATAGSAGDAPAHPERLGLGRTPTPAQLAAIDIDANPAGVGLPPGRGTYDEGAAVYRQKCAACHGAQGEGVATYPALVGAEPRAGFPFASDPKIAKTIGNYWPYATTVYDYVHRAMPLDAPGSLPPHEVYALVAYLLAENQVVPRTFVADAASLPAVRMPARDRFVPDDRTGGSGFR